MLPHGWTVWCLFLAVPLALCSLDIVDSSSGVTCSQGLWDCTVKDGSPFESSLVKVTDLRAEVKLCCRAHECGLCLQIHVEVDLEKPGEGESHSGLMEDEGTEETKDHEDETGSVTVCYQTPEVMPTCTKVEFMVNQQSTGLSRAQISVIITHAKISYGSLVYTYSPHMQEKIKVIVPSLENVCFSDIHTYVEECDVPKVGFSRNKENQVELHFGDSDGSVPEVCLQNEMDGTCRKWDRKPIPLESVMPCTCFQAWREGELMHSRSCPFKNNSTLRQNIWKNFTFSVSKNPNSTELWWSVSSPCRLDGDVWTCERSPGSRVCTEGQGRRQQLGTGSWRQNSNGLWEKVGVFENYSCVMIKIRDMMHEMGPFCHNNINRWRWSLFAVAVMLLLSLTLLITFCLRKFIKESVRGWCYGEFVKIPRRHVLVLSPPDGDGEVSAAVGTLGSLLMSRDLSVTVDQWSRKGQLSMGPLPWSHGQLLSVDSQGERVVLLLTPKAVEKAQRWSDQDSPALGPPEESPYSDVFKASLFAIQAFKNQDRASERFVLVTFDYLWTDNICLNKLPQVLRGLPLFHFPSQTKALLMHLGVGKRQRQLDRGRWTRTLCGNKCKNQPVV